MKKQDARRLDYKGLTQLRQRAVNAVQNGESPETVARVFGISRAALYNWLAKFRQGGLDQLDARKRGGRRPKLNGRAFHYIYDTITLKNPIQFKFPSALWTLPMVVALIYDKYNIRLSASSVNRMLNQLGLTPQRPMLRINKQNPEAVNRWLDQEFPRIKAMAHKVKAGIFFADEAEVRSDLHGVIAGCKQVQTPIVSSPGTRFGLHMISAINPRGQVRFMVAKGQVGADFFIEFFKRLIDHADKPTFLIVRAHPSHKSKKVAKYLDSVSDRLRLFFLPPYSPELHPDETVWNKPNYQALGRNVMEPKVRIKRTLIPHKGRIRKNPDLICNH